MKQGGFTLIELLIVISIIAFLSLLGFFAIGNKIKQARDADRQTDLYEIRIGLEQYYIHEIKYPDALTFSNQPLKSIDGQQIFLDRIHKDPVNLDPYRYTYIATPSGMPAAYTLCARYESKAGSFCLHNLQR